MQTAQKLHSSAVTHQTLKQPHPLEFNRTTPDAYQLIAMSLQQADTQLDSSPPFPLNLKQALSFEKQG